MMRLSMIWAVDATVDAAGASPLAAMIAARWAHEPGSMRHFRSSANFIYTLRHAGGPAFLRFTPATERTRAMIAAELALLDWLARQGIAVVTPLPARDGATLATVETARGLFHAVLFAALEGAQRDNAASLATPQLRAWGAALGRLHAAARRPDAPSLAARPTLADYLAAARQHIPRDQPGVLAEHDRLAAALAALTRTPDRYGPIHGDFELDNLIWRGDEIAILDFDGCANGWYATDIAFALRDLLDVGATAADPAVRAFLDGYRAHASLRDADLANLPLFSRLARHLAYAAMARARDLPPGGDYPAWLTRLDARLAARMAAYAARCDVVDQG